MWVLWHMLRSPRPRTVDDHELVRRGLHALLDADLTQEVVGEASSADEAVEMAATLTPDVVVMDVRMPGRSGIEACRDIRSAREETRVLMLTSLADDEACHDALRLLPSWPSGVARQRVATLAGLDSSTC